MDRFGKVAFERLSSYAPGESLDFEHMHGSALEEAYREVTTLTSAGFFLPVHSLPGIPRTWKAYAMTLESIHRCNLRCKYCYSGSGTSFAGEPRDMPLDTAKAAIHFLTEKFGRTGMEFDIGLGLTGEPLLNFDLIQSVVAYCKALEQASNGRRRFSFSISTNGTILSEKIVKFICDNKIGFSISLDGPPEIHDKVRTFRNGRGTYDRIEALVSKYLPVMQANNIRVVGHAVITPYQPDMVGILQRLCNLGFDRIIMKPVGSGTDGGHALTLQNVDKLKEAYTRLSDFLLEKTSDGEVRYFNRLSPRMDFLKRFIARLLMRAKFYWRCDAGMTSVTICANGDIYPCPRCVGIGELSLGNIFSSGDLSRQERLVSMQVDHKQSCMKCWARYLCGGGCYWAAYLKNGDIAAPDPVECEIVKHLIKLSMSFIYRLSSRNQEMLELVTEGIRQDKPNK